MQKRSLLFIFSLSLALLCVNLFIKPKTPPQKPQQTIEQTILPSTLESRVATQAELPLVDVYKDPEGQKLLTTALNFKGNLLTLAWDEESPQEVYFRKSHSSFPLEKASLSSQNSTLADPVIYKSNSAPKSVVAADLPASGSFELQLVHPQAFDSHPDVLTAGYSKGQFSLHGQSLTGDAIAVTKTNEGFEPVGIYIGKEENLVPLKNFFDFKSAFSFHKLPPPQRSNPEKFYILQNDYHQLVFSSYGGALAEINLPFKTAENQKSGVYPLELDKKIADASSQHSFFPAHSYFTPGKDATGPFIEHTEKEAGGYYPLIRRSTSEDQFNPRYYAFNIVSDFPEISELPYKVTYFDDHKIVFQATQNHRKITKTYSLKNENSPYSLDLSVKIDGDSRGLWLTTGVPEAELVANAQSPSLKYSQTRNNKFEVEKQALPKTSTEIQTIAPEWISNSNGYFTIILEPVDTISSGYKVNKITSNVLPSRLSSPSVKTKASKIKDLPGYEFLLPLKDSSEEMHFNIFAGPLEKSVLQKANAAKEKSSPDYSKTQTYHGLFSFITEPFSKLLFVVMNFFHNLVGSWGISILLLTVFFRVVLYPLNSWSIKAMKRGQEIAPEIEAISKKYAKDPQKKNIETMALYRKKKVNPFSGCLPLLIQFPFMIGMFNLLRSTFVLRGVPFIHGWINNLTAPDVLFSWTTPLPIIGTEFHLLPILSSLLIWAQQRMMSPTPKDKSLMTDKQKQQKMMGNMFLLFMTFAFYNFPSGLNIYFIFSTFLGILQQWLTFKLIDKKSNQPTIIDKKAKEA